jgi:capsular polysaccharide transport system ATP-binding protein
LGNIALTTRELTGLQIHDGLDQAIPLDPNRPRIEAIGITKVFHTEIGPRTVLDDINFVVEPGDKFAILGRNGAGKSTLIRILSGIIKPTSGEIIRKMRMSWPLALGGQFEGMLTGYDNVRFIAKLYGADVERVFDYTEWFTELGPLLNVQTRFYSDGMRMRLAFALSLAIDFDCILIDEVLFVGDEKFQKKCQRELFEVRRHKTMLLAIHSVEFVNDFCNQALVLKRGRGRVFSDVRLATAIYSTL